MPEQFERLIELLRREGVLDRCTSISCEGASVTLAPKQVLPESAPRREVPEQPGVALFNTLTAAFPGAAVPRSLRGETPKGGV